MRTSLPSSARPFGPVFLRLALLLTVAAAVAPSLGCGPTAPCTAAPPRPIGALVSQQEWDQAVHGNCFINLQRVNRWFGQTKPLGETESPAPLFIPVGENGITSGSVVVIAHGWAPTYRKAVDDAGGNLLWWGPKAANQDTKEWTSNWAWVATKGTSVPIAISDTGLFQQAIAQDSNAIVLGYSWIDDSATRDSSFVELDLVYRSEAYTNVNGLRLAGALEQALAPEFWTGSGNRLHIIGHSHGSKVATTATLALQSRGKKVDHLTVLDSPESESTLAANGANLLGFYLDRIQTNDGTASGQSGTFVDNYVSYFGAGFNGSANADRVVDVILDPEVYSCFDPGDRHSYSAEWYAGAAPGAANNGLPPLGFRWPPPQEPHTPALNQTWPGGEYTERAQWQLQAGSAGTLGCEFSAEICAYGSPATAVKTISTFGNVSGTPASGLVFAAGSGSGSVTSSFRGSTDFGSTQYGIAFDVEWTSPEAGDYLVITGNNAADEYEVLLVMDGKSAIPGRNPVAMNTEVVDSLEFDIYYLPAEGNAVGRVAISHFRAVTIDCGDGAAATDTADAETGEPAAATDAG